MTAPAAILFDFGGTLDADGVAWKERFAALVRAEGLDVPAERFDRAYYAADDALVGTVPAELDLGSTVRRLAEGLARELDLPADLGDRVGARFLGDSLAQLALSAALLERLAPRFRLGIVSNFYGNLGAVCAGTGIGRHLGVAVDSAAIGFEKPDPRIFQAALSALDAAPEETLFVGDSLARDMTGARRLGMPHVWLAPGTAAGCCAGDRVIPRLSALPELFP